MNIPNPPIKEFSDVHPIIGNFISILIKQMKLNLSDEGLNIPNQPTTAIDQLTNTPNGSVIYDETTHEAKIKVNGTYKTITTA